MIQGRAKSAAREGEPGPINTSYEAPDNDDGGGALTVTVTGCERAPTFTPSLVIRARNWNVPVLRGASPANQ